MGRGKISMELITNERSRMVTYQKRKKGLIKKVEEFHILCQVDACVIIMGPRFNYRCTDTEAWPTNTVELERIIKRYRSGKSSDIRMKRSQDLNDYFVTRKKKLDDEIERVKRSNLEAKFPKWSKFLNYLTYQQLWSFEKSLEGKIELARKRILEIKSYQVSINEEYEPIGTSNFRHANINIFQSNGMVGGSYNTTFDHQQQGFYNQMLSLNVNPMDNPMMITMKGEDFVQFGGNMSYNFDPTTTMSENMMVFNNPNLYPMSYLGPYKQPLLPYQQGSIVPSGGSQKCNVHPQFGEFGGVNVFEMNKSKGTF